MRVAIHAGYMQILFLKMAPNVDPKCMYVSVCFVMLLSSCFGVTSTTCVTWVFYNV